MNTIDDSLKCSKCGTDERLVQDTVSKRIYCRLCAHELCQIVWNRPAVIREEHDCSICHRSHGPEIQHSNE